MEPSSTNYPIASFFFLLKKNSDNSEAHLNVLENKIQCSCYSFLVLSKEIGMKSAERFVGGYSMEVPPLTIPNREVKLHSADGTIIDGRVGRCQLNITLSSIAIAIGLLCF